MFRPIVFFAPEQPNPKSEYEADEIEFAPRLVESDHQYADIEHRIEAEQRDMAAAASRRKDRGEKTADDAGDGKCTRILQHGKRCRKQRNNSQDGEGEGRRQQMVKT